MNTLLLTLIGAIAMRVTAVDTESVTNVTCPELKQCFSDTIGGGDYGDSLLSKEVYKKLVKTYAEFKSFYETTKPLCKDRDTLKEIEVEGKLFGYICSAEGKKDINALANSTCNADQQVGKVPTMVMSQCVKSLKSDLIKKPKKLDICPVFELLMDCIYIRTERACGKAYAKFVQKVLVIRYDDPCNSNAKVDS